MTSVDAPERPPALAAPVASSARTLAEWLAHAESLHPAVIDMGLARVAAVRDAMGLRPRVPVITVAGTNGKGSTCATLDACLRAAGYRVGLYTSPHLVRFNERVCIDGEPVDDELLCAAYERVERARTHVSLTPFEFATLAAVALLVEQQVDVLVLEVGLGGRLDAVNAFDADCAILTGVDLDHQDYLGPTREHIGREKAGVFRPGRPAICADPAPPASVIGHAAAIGAAWLQIGRDFRIERVGQAWRLVTPAGVLGPLPWPVLAGDFQLRNAAAALLALQCLADRLPAPPGAWARGLTQVHLAGRFQRIPARAFDTVLDVAHNPQAAESLAFNLAQQAVPGRTLAVFGMLQDKDIAGVAQRLNAQVDAWYVAGIAERRGASAERVADALKQAGIARPIERDDNPVAAYQHACRDARTGDRVLVCGSFVTVGQVLAQLERR